jgi:hypothetical protein
LAKVSDQAQRALVPVPLKELPTDVILSFPVYIGRGDEVRIRWLPGSLLTPAALAQVKDSGSLYIQKQHTSFLSLYRPSHGWSQVSESDLDRFSVDYLNSLLLRVFYFKKMDNYTFISLYDFLDRFRQKWLSDLRPQVKQMLTLPSEWHQAFRYRVVAAYAALLTAKRLGYTSFYDLIDYFMGTLMADIGHFGAFANVSQFFAKAPAEWFFDQQHPDTSLQMLQKIEDLSLAVRQAVARHHEYVDGTGFPKGIKGSSAIPEHAQVIGLCTEFVFGMFLGTQAQAGEDTASFMKNELLKNRGRYNTEVFTASQEVLTFLF